ncbi:MAG: thioredoxin family protein [Cyclobacteriaceae bacterium]
MKRTVEIFTAGCRVCDPVVKLVKETACDDCEITVYDLIKQCEEKICLEKVKTYGVKNVPSIAVNGKLLDCCTNEITQTDLVNAGIGQPI